jgi:hypothetical protein
MQIELVKKDKFYVSLGDSIDSLLGSIKKNSVIENEIIDRIIKELSKVSILDFDAGLCVPFSGDLYNPLSLSLAISEENPAVLHNLADDVVYRYWSVVEKVRDKYGYDDVHGDIAVKFITGDFSDISGGINYGELSKYKFDLYKKYSVAIEYEEKITEIFDDNSIKHWVLRADSYRNGTYITSFYRGDEKYSYSAREVDCFNALLPFLYRVCSVSANGWSGAWVGLMTCESKPIMIFDSCREEHNYYGAFIGAMARNERAFLTLINGISNKAYYDFVDDDFGISFLVVKLRNPRAVSPPILAVTAGIARDVINLDPVYEAYKIA